MSTEYFLHDKESNDVINLRDVIAPKIYTAFIDQYINSDGGRRRSGVEIIIDDSVDTYCPEPVVFKIKPEE